MRREGLTTGALHVITFSSSLILMAMNYTPGPYTPFPVSGERSETPPPDFNPSHPFTGVELTVLGLPFTTITSAADHLNQTLQDIVSDGTPMPDLQVVSPSARQPLDFVYVSLSGPLKENPRPDILEQVRVRLDAIDGLEARWKVSSGRSDKTRQAYFEVEESLNPLHVKTRIDNILDKIRDIFEEDPCCLPIERRVAHESQSLAQPWGRRCRNPRLWSVGIVRSRATALPRSLSDTVIGWTLNNPRRTPTMTPHFPLPLGFRGRPGLSKRS